MRFVAAAANMRSAVFSIPLLSLFDAKGIAGNIIPAIATTNAVVAGLQVSFYQPLTLCTTTLLHYN